MAEKENLFLLRWKKSLLFLACCYLLGGFVIYPLFRFFDSEGYVFFNYFLKDLLLLQLPIIKTSFKYFTVISFTYSQNLSKELFNFKNINHYYISKINQYINESIFCK